MSTNKYRCNIHECESRNGQLVSTLANELSHYVDAKNGHEFKSRTTGLFNEKYKDALAEFEDIIWLLKNAAFAEKMSVNDFSAGAVVDSRLIF